MGLRDFAHSEDRRNFLVNVNELSPATTEVIDQEINRLLQESFNRAKEILIKYKVGFERRDLFATTVCERF